MATTDDFGTNQERSPIRSNIFEIFPNGDGGMMTGISGRIQDEVTRADTFKWAEEEMPYATFTLQGSGCYTDVDLQTAYSSGADQAAGSTVFFSLLNADAESIAEGDTVFARDNSNLANDMPLRVTRTPFDIDGTNSVVTCKLIKADGVDGAGDLSDCDRLTVISDSSPDGGDVRDVIGQTPTEVTNYIQDFREPVKITDIAAGTALEYGSPHVARVKKRALKRHTLKINRALIFGHKLETTGSNGEKEWLTHGLVEAIRDYNSAGNIFDFYNSTASAYAAKTWVQKGEDFLNDSFQTIFKRGSMEKIALCGIGAAAGIDQVARMSGQVQLEPAQSGIYGFHAKRYVTAGWGGILNVVVDADLVHQARDNLMIVFEPALLKARPFAGLDTKYRKIDPGGKTLAEYGEYRTVLGLEYHNPGAFGILDGVGLDNVTA